MIEKKLALCQYLDIDYFEFDNQYYIRSNQDDFDEKISSLTEDGDENEEMVEDIYYYIYRTN